VRSRSTRLRLATPKFFASGRRGKRMTNEELMLVLVLVIVIGLRIKDET